MTTRPNPAPVFAKFGRPFRPELPTVAYLTNQLPFPAHSGGQVREAQLLARLSERFNICLGALTAELDRDLRNIDQSLELFCEVVLAPALDHGGGSGHRRLVDNEQFSALWAERVRAADLVHVEGYFLMHHVPDDAPPIVLVAENIEHALHRDRAGGGDGWHETRDREIAAWRRAAVCGAVSAADLRSMRAAAPDVPGVLVTNGWDHLADALWEPDDVATPDEPSLVYTGNYGWGPTADGAYFLLEEIWPLVRARHPTVRLVLAGAGPTDRMRELAGPDDRVRITGRLPSLVGVLKNATVYICPLRYSGGTEVKLVEALFAGCAVVSTSESFLGIPDGCHGAVTVADSAEDLAESCLMLLDDPALRQQRADLAAKCVADMPSWDEGAAALEAAWTTARLSGSAG